jgi:glycosyltransferase involved in cell wall biosynthesis
VKQTCFALSQQKSIVVSVEMHSPIKFIEAVFSIFFSKPLFLIKKHSGIYLFRPILLPYANKLLIVYQLSLILNCLLLQIFLWFRYPHKKKYVWMIFPQLQWLLTYFFHTYKIIYDIVDYFTSPVKKEAQKLEFYKKELLHQSNFIFANSHILKKKSQHNAKNSIYVVPQGFRLHEYEKQIHIKNNLVIGKKKPIIGFIGGINERLDSNLLLALIPKHQEWQFVFVGAFEHDTNVHNIQFDRLYTMVQNCSNVTLLPRQNPNSLPFLLKQFTICMIPYDVSQDFNRYCYPMKLFEYFYMGKPVISTPIEELKRFPKYVKIGNTAKDWEKCIEMLLHKPWPRNFSRDERNIAVDNSWERKIQMMLKHIEYTII